MVGKYVNIFVMVALTHLQLGGQKGLFVPLYFQYRKTFKSSLPEDLLAASVVFF